MQLRPCEEQLGNLRGVLRSPVDEDSEGLGRCLQPTYHERGGLHGALKSPRLLSYLPDSFSHGFAPSFSSKCSVISLSSR